MCPPTLTRALSYWIATAGVLAHAAKGGAAAWAGARAEARAGGAGTRGAGPGAGVDGGAGAVVAK
jgi:hypothetical protein